MTSKEVEQRSPGTLGWRFDCGKEEGREEGGEEGSQEG